MKIIFIIPNMTGGGTERVISLLSDEYVRKGFDVAIMQFAGYEHAYPLNDKVEDFSVAPKSNGNPFVMIRRLIAMRRYFRENPDSYIFAFCVMGAVFSVMTTWGMKRPILVAERNSPDSCNVKALRNWAYRRALRITFQTEDGISYFPGEIAGKAVVIPNPVDADMPKPYTGSRSHRVVTAGRLHKQKNHALLLEAFADFVKKFPDYELHIYGEGAGGASTDWVPCGVARLLSGCEGTNKGCGHVCALLRLRGNLQLHAGGALHGNTDDFYGLSHRRGENLYCAGGERPVSSGRR